MQPLWFRTPDYEPVHEIRDLIGELYDILRDLERVVEKALTATKSEDTSGTTGR